VLRPRGVPSLRLGFSVPCVVGGRYPRSLLHLAMLEPWSNGVRFPVVRFNPIKKRATVPLAGTGPHTTSPLPPMSPLLYEEGKSLVRLLCLGICVRVASVGIACSGDTRELRPPVPPSQALRISTTLTVPRKGGFANLDTGRQQPVYLLVEHHFRVRYPVSRHSA
jgi:hypothetical protein